MRFIIMYFANLPVRRHLNPDFEVAFCPIAFSMKENCPLYVDIIRSILELQSRRGLMSIACNLQVNKI